VVHFYFLIIGTALVSDWQGITVKAVREMCPALVWSATRTLFSPIGSISDEFSSNVWQQSQFVSVATDKTDYIWY